VVRQRDEVSRESPVPCGTYSVEQAGVRLGIGRALAYRAVQAGEIPHIKIGKRIVVPKPALDAMLRAGIPQQRASR
jgi:excisionase family DNA binding protein